jgi:hypothetical protein
VSPGADNVRAEGSSDRGRRPLTKGAAIRYIRLSGGGAIFFDDGDEIELGGNCHELKEILGAMKLELLCSHTVDAKPYLAREGERISEYKGNAPATVTASINYTADRFRLTTEHVTELLNRDYFYMNEVLPALSAGGYRPHSTRARTCLPAILDGLRGANDRAALEALEGLLLALPGRVYLDNLLEFMFEYLESIGRTDCRQRWSDRGFR